nr:immunoglobulin heavy chain junction region [Macaca mulatta]MOV47682.1 immunoglobulin heavy chain junction region [Macaca mulatta]MOV47764.1 immunoglobulin heavy chain junction region [Macaca mulatta]MOV47846.1 immunoglobulin heavy chain junction region [Macaca mulatta]MOV48187.1 immunoglobulin heavy chain junction region [Macaca mulatta]
CARWSGPDFDFW